MGSLASGIFGLVAGDPTKLEENELQGLSGYETNTGEGATTAANDYYSGILSGDPAQVAMTLAPEISASQTEAQQKKQTNAEFGNRSGGTNASNQSIDAGERGNIINLIGSERSAAARGEAGLGTDLLSQSSNNINSQASLARAQNTAERGDIGGIVQGAAQIASGIAGGVEGGGMTPSDMFDMGNSGGPVATQESDFSGLIPQEAAPEYQF